VPSFGWKNYSLDAVAREVLGEGKGLSNPTPKTASPKIIHNYRHNLPAFALYRPALTPASPSNIVSKLDLIRLAFGAQSIGGHDSRPGRGEHRLF